MSDFSELHQKAVFDLPFRLMQSRSNNPYASWGRFFCVCLPALSSYARMDGDAELLRLTARVLNKHPTFTDDDKYQALFGLYIYIWQSYDPLNQLTNRTFLGILGEHLNVASLSEIESSRGLKSLEKLDEFCEWVGQQQDPVVVKLYTAFPLDIRNQIYDYLHPTDSSWMSFSW